MNFIPEVIPVWSQLLHWGLVVLPLTIALLLLATLTELVTTGPRGLGRLFGNLGDALIEVFELSPRRVFAIIKLTIIEALRRKALYVFVVFAILFMFAGWFISDAGDKAVQVHVAFILNALSWLTFIVMIMLSCIGLPEDIRLRSIHTVVTKPISRFEIVLGRILGYIAVGTIVLGIMGVISLVWTYRQVPAKYQYQLTARRPVYGDFTFIDNQGERQTKGKNVGDKNEFRGYIEGATKERAIYTFPGVSRAMLVEMTDPRTNEKYKAIPLESRFQAFRSHKGNMNRSLNFQLILINPDTKLEVPVATHPIVEFVGRTDGLRETLVAPGAVEGKTTFNLFDDFVAKDGTLTIAVACTDPGQYLGMAKVDLFIRQPDNSFTAGYLKAVFGVWLLMVMLVTFGVTVSTFVKGPFAILLTFSFLIVGSMAQEFLGHILSDKWQGGGTFESVYRLVTFMNDSTPMPAGIGTNVIKSIDWVINQFLFAVQNLLPNFSPFYMSKYIANGFDVSAGAAVIPATLATIGYFIPCVLLGFLALRFRELEAK